MLAQRVQYDKGYLSKVELGRKPFTLNLARQIDSVLGTEGVLVRMMTSEATTDDPPRIEATTDVFPADDGLTSLELPHASVLQAAAVGAARSDDAVFALWGLLDQYRELGRRVSPRLVLGPVVAQTSAVDMLAKAAPVSSSVARSLIHLVSRYAEYAGWLFQEAGNHAAAHRWTGYAASMAAAGDLPDVLQFCRIRVADMLLSEFRFAEAIPLAEQIQGVPRASRYVHGLAALVEARGRAQAGELSACEAVVARAEEWIAAQDQERVLVPLGFAGVADPTKAVRGWALRELGRPLEGARLLESAIRDSRPRSIRTRARLTVQCVAALLESGEWRGVEDRILGVVDDVVAVDSASIHAEFRRVLRTLNRWPNRLQETRSLVNAMVSNRSLSMFGVAGHVPESGNG